MERHLCSRIRAVILQKALLLNWSADSVKSLPNYQFSLKTNKQQELIIDPKSHMKMQKSKLNSKKKKTKLKNLHYKVPRFISTLVIKTMLNWHKNIQTNQRKREFLKRPTCFGHLIYDKDIITVIQRNWWSLNELHWIKQIFIWIKLDGRYSFSYIIEEDTGTARGKWCHEDHTANKPELHKMLLVLVMSQSISHIVLFDSSKYSFLWKFCR